MRWLFLVLFATGCGNAGNCTYVPCPNDSAPPYQQCVGEHGAVEYRFADARCSAGYGCAREVSDYCAGVTTQRRCSIYLTGAVEASMACTVTTAYSNGLGTVSLAVQ